MFCILGRGASGGQGSCVAWESHWQHTRQPSCRRRAAPPPKQNHTHSLRPPATSCSHHEPQGGVGVCKGVRRGRRPTAV